MASYTINYLDGHTETVTADDVVVDDDSNTFVFRSNFQSQADAIVPTPGVRSVHRHSDKKATA